MNRKFLNRLLSVIVIAMMLIGTGALNPQPVHALGQPEITNLFNADKWYSDGGGECDGNGSSFDISVIIGNMLGGNENNSDGHHDCGDDGDDGNGNDDNSNDDNSNDSNTNDDDDNENDSNNNDTPTCEELGNCPPPPTCEELGNCPPPPTCEELGNCPPPPTCEELGNCPPVINEIEEEDAPRQIKKVAKATIIPVTGGDYCSICFTGLVYKADQETDLNSWIKEVSEDDLSFIIQIGFQADDWYDEVLEYGIHENASFILTWYELNDEKWITSAVDILKTAGVTCFTFAFDANEDPSWVNEAKRISEELIK